MSRRRVRSGHALDMHHTAAYDRLRGKLLNRNETLRPANGEIVHLSGLSVRFLCVLPHHMTV